MAESGGGRDSQIYSSEVYSWSPVYRNQRGGGEPSSAAPYSSNRQSVLYHSGLKQQVAGRQAELQEVSVRKETAVEVRRTLSSGISCSPSHSASRDTLHPASHPEVVSLSSSHHVG